MCQLLMESTVALQNLKWSYKMDLNEENKWNEVKLSNQAITTLMMVLQKCLLEQTDITFLLKDLVFARNMDTNELVVMNPPTVSFNERCAGETD